MTQYYDDTAKDYAERAEAAAESASQSKQQASTAAATATTQANIATNAAQNAATLVKSDLENDVRAMKDSALSAASQASSNAAAASASAVDASHDAIDADQSRQAAQAAQTAAEAAQTAAETAMGNAASSAGAALASAQAAASSESNAAGSASAAASSESNASTSASNAGVSAQNAATSETNAADSAKLSQSWAVGGTGKRQDEDTNNAQYWAEQSRQFSPDNKANKPSPLPEESGHLAEVDTDGNLVTSPIKSDKVAKRDGYYGQDGLGAATAENLIDPNASGTDRRFGFDTACGDISISDNGNAVIEKLMGTTHVANQLVHDTNMNTKSSTDGKLALTDAVGGNLSKLEIHGGCVVHNQLVKDSISKTVSGTGRLGCSDGVAGNAESFVMTAPRSVVMNQLVPSNKKDFTIRGNGGAYYALTNTGIQFTIGHKYAISLTGTASSDDRTSLGVYIQINGNTPLNPSSLNGNAINVGETRTVIWMFSPTSSNKLLVGLTSRDTTVIADANDYVELSDFMIVDLTQYFNGNTTLIDSITSWDDLVAYDPTFANYVQYNTGTVKGVQPTVKVNHTTDVACPVELFGVGSAADEFEAVSGVMTRKMRSYTFTGNESVFYTDWHHVEGYYAAGLTRATLSGIVFGDPNMVGIGNVILPSVITRSEAAIGSTTNPVVGISLTSSPYASFLIRVPSSIATDNASLLTWLTGQTVYYELATPTTTQYNPTTIPTVDIYNSAVQTSNERLASLSMTYQGREQTIALDPTHTYVFNDNQVEDSVVTGQSTLDVVGGEDMVVDVTQLYNGDSTKISQIQRWASLSTRFHRYRDLMPYNPGTVEPDTPVVRNYPDEYAYGVIYDPNQSSPACVKVELRNGVVTEVEDFDSMPCHQLYRCVMDDLANRHIAYYLDDEDSNKKYNGTRNGVTSDGSSSVLTGADGDVMVEIPISYWYLDEDYQGTGKVLWLISDRPFMGTHGPAEIHDFFYVSPDGATCRTQYVGAYKAAICDADGNPLNTTEGALAQVAGTASTNKVRSIAGALPYVHVNINDLTVKSGRNGGSTVNTLFHQWLMLLMVVEQGSLNTQLISQGYANGINTGYCFWRKSGRVNAGNGTAEIFANVNSQDMDNFQSFKVGSTTVQRDTLRDADGRYAWSVYNRTGSSVRYFTDNTTPTNGDTVYSASTGDATEGTVASYTIREAEIRVIQFQYRGIEDPFAAVWEFEHGLQVYRAQVVKAIKVNNIIYERVPSADGPVSAAWGNDGSFIWTSVNVTNQGHTFLDENLEQDSGYTLTLSSYVPYVNGYWETRSIDSYTSVEQQTSANPTYSWVHHVLPVTQGFVKKFDLRTFIATTVGGSGTTFLPDYHATAPLSRISIIGGRCINGAWNGMGFRAVDGNLNYALVVISGRPSA